jgi:hypothetical protein
VLQIIQVATKRSELFACVELTELTPPADSKGLVLNSERRNQVSAHGPSRLNLPIPPEDGRLKPETCRGLRHNKVILKVKVYYVGYVIVIRNDTRSTKHQTYVVLSVVCLYLVVPE